MGTKTPGPGFTKDEVPVPTYVTQQATDAYRSGYVGGWYDAGKKFGDDKKAGFALDPKGNKLYPAAQAPAANDINPGPEYEDIGAAIYRRGYVDGWEESWMAYVRQDRGS